MSDSTMARVLIVFDIVSKFGPIPLAQVVRRAGFSRASVWRCLDVLREMGWVRMRLGDNGFEVTHARRLGDATGHAGPDNALSISQFMAHLEQDLDAEVTLGGFSQSGYFSIIESTTREAYQVGNVSFFRDRLALAAVLYLDRVLSVKVFRQFAVECSKADRIALENGYHTAEIKRLRVLGYVSSSDSSEVAVPVRLNGQSGYAVRVTSKAGVTLDVDSLFGWISDNCKPDVLELLN